MQNLRILGIERKNETLLIKFKSYSRDIAYLAISPYRFEEVRVTRNFLSQIPVFEEYNLLTLETAAEKVKLAKRFMEENHAAVADYRLIKEIENNLQDFMNYNYPLK